MLCLPWWLFVAALFVGMIQNKGLSFEEKLKIIAKGAGDVNIITMVLIFLVAGAFSGIEIGRAHV